MTNTSASRTASSSGNSSAMCHDPAAAGWTEEGLANTGGGNVTFNSTVRGDADGNRELTLNAGAGNVDMPAAVGGANLDLKSFTVISANDVELTDVTTQAGTGSDTIDVTAGNDHGGLVADGRYFKLQDGSPMYLVGKR